MAELEVLYLSQKSMDSRLGYCKTWSTWTLKKWRTILFSDETKFNLVYSDGKVYVWREPNTEFNLKNCVPIVKHRGGSVMV